MRLINEDDVIKEIQRLKHVTVMQKLRTIDAVEHVPTAYDVDKVVGEIERERHDVSFCCDEEKEAYLLGLESAIDDVKDGWVNGKQKEEFGRWIPCSERLPKKPEIYGDSDGYIVQTRHVMQPFSAYWDGIEWTDDDDDAVDDVIAWMPLPEPYREV
jgi:hypothetical protein